MLSGFRVAQLHQVANNTTRVPSPAEIPQKNSWVPRSQGRSEDFCFFFALPLAMNARTDHVLASSGERRPSPPLPLPRLGFESSDEARREHEPSSAMWPRGLQVAPRAGRCFRDVLDSFRGSSQEFPEFLLVVERAASRGRQVIP